MQAALKKFNGHPACLYGTDVEIFSQDPVGVQIVYIYGTTMY
jgi:hypothetical protein